MLEHHISPAQVQFHPHSFADPDGRLFWLDGGLYRAISHEKTPFFTRLFEDGTIPQLIQRGFLVGSERTDLVLDGYGMVLRHTPVPFVSYPNEWCLAMFKDAALTYLDLLKELLSRRLTLKDTHPWNLLFDRSRPVFVDITSITALRAHSNSPDYRKFCRYYLYPLVLMSQGQERIVRCLLPEYDGILPSDFSLLTRGSGSLDRLISGFKSGLRSRVPQRCRELLSDIVSRIPSIPRKNSAKTRTRLETLAVLKRQIEAVSVPYAPEEYSDNLNARIQEYLLRIISQLAPVSVLTIGAKTLWYSSLAELGSKVVIFDRDSAYITRLYLESRHKRLQVLPLVMDFTDPTPSRGFSGHVSIAAAERFQCDLVLAVSLLNPLIFERHLRFDQVVEGLAQFSKRWLIVDYSAPENLRTTSGDLTRALLKRFRNVSKLQLDSEGDNLLLCEK